MKQAGQLGGFVLPVLAGMMACCGCVAIDVGEPEAYRHTDTHFDTATSPSATHVERARAQKNQSNAVLTVGLAADVQEEYPKLRWDETTTIRVQRRLGVGLFPGATEVYLKPSGALDPLLLGGRKGRHGNEYALYSTHEDNYWAVCLVGSIVSLGLQPTIGTLATLFLQPFADWGCDHDFIEKGCMDFGKFPENGVRYADATKSEKIRAFKAFSPEERKRMGVVTCYDQRAKSGGTTMGHVGLIGCFKHQAVFVEPAKAGAKTATGEVETKRQRVDVEGPYVVELSIPAVGYSRVVRVKKGATQAEFALPAAERRSVAEAVVRFRADGTGGESEVTREALEMVAGKEYPVDVTLQGGAGGAAVVPAAATRTAAGNGYEVVGITRSNGCYVIRVRIADKSQTFDIGWALEPYVKRKIREDFARRHPGVGIQDVRELVEWETEDDGNILVYRGWAFSARPVADGWTYDAESRRGTVRLRISEGMPAAKAEQWAKDNIEAIVREKNVVLEAGKAPPAGAAYKSMSESLVDGVLTVEFMAVE